ncbi:MAG TPA: cell surface protein SprA, partial [Candidatus Krumholzibacteria bacterium]|nr:cell surface protein SprA [Candidatus Krumholzibacteria bacterium]
SGGVPDPDADPALANRTDFTDAPRWRRLGVEEWRPLVDANSGQLIGVLLNSELDDNVALGVTYNVVDDKGNLVMRVGRPWFSGDFDAIDNPDNPGDPNDKIYYFKLIKPLSQAAPDPTNPSSYGQGYDLCWEYMFRNFYFMRGVGIDLTTLDVQILTTVKQTLNEFDTVPPDGTRRRWINIFGLDKFDPQGNPVEGGDGTIDTGSEANLVFPDLGLLEFPNPTPFAAKYLTGKFENGGNDGVPAPDLYLKSLTSTGLQSNHFFDLEFQHSSTSSRLSLGTINIKENSEQVRLDGRILTRGVDYDIDYFSGEITLTGAASELNAQTNITVDFEVDPLFGGGRTSLNGINLGYHLGQNKTLSTTWLLQSKPSNNRKPRLGEEPTKNWVGNVSAKLQFEPKILTSLANLLPMVDSDTPSRLTVDGELAVSIPNPNTNGSAYLDDFEAVDKSDVIPMGREGWWWASLPAEYANETDVDRRFQPQDRAYVRWYRPTPAVNREDLNPDLSEQERRDVVPALELQMEPPKGTETFADTLFTGIMRGYGSDLDLTEAQYLEFWVNDFQKSVANREGVLHFDFGFINEDFYWKTVFDDALQRNVLQRGVLDQEDTDNDGQLSTAEDVGLDGIASAEESAAEGPLPPYLNVPDRSDDHGGDDFDSSREDDADPFPRINGLELNQRLDSEDINLNGSLDMADAYYTLSVPLDDTDHVLVDVNRDYPAFVSSDERKVNNSWRKYRLDMKEVQLRLARQGEFKYLTKAPDLSRVRFLRIWYEVPGGSSTGRRDIQFAEMRFLGNRWLTDGIHDSQSHDRFPAGAEAPAEFRVGVLNNKDNPDYIPPVFPDTRNNVAEKEQSLQLDYANLGPGQEIRVRKDVPGSQGQDFSQYNELNFFWRAPLASRLPAQLDPDQQGLVP